MDHRPAHSSKWVGMSLLGLQHWDQISENKAKNVCVYDILSATHQQVIKILLEQFMPKKIHMLPISGLQLSSDSAAWIR